MNPNTITQLELAQLAASTMEKDARTAVNRALALWEAAGSALRRKAEAEASQRKQGSATQSHGTKLDQFIASVKRRNEKPEQVRERVLDYLRASVKASMQGASDAQISKEVEDRVKQWDGAPNEPNNIDAEDQGGQNDGAQDDQADRDRNERVRQYHNKVVTSQPPTRDWYRENREREILEQKRKASEKGVEARRKKAMNRKTAKRVPRSSKKS